ncbi:unnamed protein product [Schistocephalus solidus]|uniref:Uncharacterized protein n=1 Tax=Schistocephalus solidus TaxID=70667 RepID=A0A183TF81_SCHSO|nr:unnamed protein product [Schistocephalus solidus]
MDGHLRTQCTNNPTTPTSMLNSANPPSESPTFNPGINSITPIIIEATSQYSSPVTPTTATTTSAEYNAPRINVNGLWLAAGLEWNRHVIHLKTKLKMYKAVVLTTLLYGAETGSQTAMAPPYPLS